MFYRGILWSVQGLIDHVASEAVYLLLGNIILEGQLHIRCLTLYGAITRMRGHTLHSLAMYQLAIKDSGSHSWFVWLGKVADIYGINLHPPLSSPWSKHQWKQYVNNTITTHWFYKFLSSASDKSSLRWISHASLKVGQCHPIWDTCPKSVHHIQAATIRARLLTGRYSVQSLRARFNQNEVNPTCRVCGLQSETITHMIVSCPALASIRQPYFSRISELLHAAGTRDPVSEDDWCSRLVLDGGPHSL